MTVQEFDAAVWRFMQIIKELAPYRTGNLAYNAIRYEKTGEHSYKIYVNLDIAPYQVYLNEPETSKHYQWWETAVELALEQVAAELKAVVQRGGAQ